MRRLCFSTLACPQWTWEEIIASAKKYGYQGVEIRGIQNELHIPNMPQFQPSAIDSTKARLDELGLEIVCLSSACEIQRESIQRETLEQARRYIDIARQLGAPYVRVLADCAASPMGRIDDFSVRFAAKELGKYAQGTGVTVLLENNGVFGDSVRLRALIEDIGMETIGVVWDVNHAFRFFSEDPSFTYDNLKPYIRHVHIKDSFMNGRIQYCMPGNGDLPIPAILRLLEFGGYGGYYSLEWLKRWEPELEEPDVILPRYFAYINDIR